MAILKCKICGGDLELNDDRTVGMCQYCGSNMTFPKGSNDEQRAAAFNRGNHFRRIGEFDKALAVYERIVREDETDAEAHWCCALCRFGIEYVEDPATFEWLPTCHRASFDSFLEDVDYLSAVEHSDGLTRRQYQKDAAKIAEVQRGILATSQNAEPYDVFICYKESDENGQRTVDSTLAQDIYYQLTEQGRKVFFARITLEDVVGTQYEPFIFAALNSAKVMIVVGTKPEYLNAVWVKNEWSRFLAMMKKDRHKLLLPCYRGMDPYDLPEQLSVLQSYDMGKIGFIQDLIRGVSKVLDADKKPEAVKETVVMNNTAPATNIAPLLERAFIFLEDGDWENADAYCEKVLDADPRNAKAYLASLLSFLRVRTIEQIPESNKNMEDCPCYAKLLRFGDEELCAKLKQLNKQLSLTQEEKKREREGKIKKALRVALLACAALAIIGAVMYIVLRKPLAYNQATSLMSSGDYHAAIDVLQNLDGYKDSYELIEQCSANIEYNAAIKLMNEGKYSEAILAFEALNGFMDSNDRIAKCKLSIKFETIKNAKVGDSVILGTYEQEFHITTENDIEWLVLDVKDGKALVVSKYALDSKPYNVNEEAVTWETCSLRQWLNNDFFNVAFTEVERSIISTVTISDFGNLFIDINGGNPTQDKVFLLSMGEVSKYFRSDEDRLCNPTTYAVRNGAYIANGHCSWWLRTPGYDQTDAALVRFDGGYIFSGLDVEDTQWGVRPAMWIDLSGI